MKKISALGVSATAYLSLAFPAFAIGPINPCPIDQGVSVTNFFPLCFETLNPGGIIQALITTAFIIATLIALAFLIYGGIRWITSGGDKTGVETARNTIVAALVGLVIVFLSYFILRIVLGFFNIDLSKLQIPHI